MGFRDEFVGCRPPCRGGRQGRVGVGGWWTEPVLRVPAGEKIESTNDCFICWIIADRSMTLAEVFDLYNRIHDRDEISLVDVFRGKLRDLIIDEGRELLRVCSTVPETPALMNLAGIYLQEGHPSLRDGKRAIELYSRAIALGNPSAMNNLGDCYRMGTDVPQDVSRAVELYSQAVSLGSPLAMNNLGYCYQHGITVPRDVIRAVELYSKAVLLGDPPAMSNLGFCYKNGIGIPRDVRKAVELFSQAVDLGISNAMNELGDCYRWGIGVVRDDGRAVELFTRAVAMGNTYAMNHLGDCHLEGIGVAPDEGKAVELYRRAVDLGDANGMNNLGRCYQYAKGVPRDEKKAIDLYERAICLENSLAMNNLGFCYYRGVGVARDEEKAIELFTRAGTATSYWYLGLSYKEKDPETAILHFCRAHSLYMEESREREAKACCDQINGLLGNSGLQITILQGILVQREEMKALVAENREKQAEIERLRAEVDYRPGGSGYMVAREDFLTKCPGRRRASI